MIEFRVDDMSCQHCVGSITAAVQALDPAARVLVDLDAHRVRIDSGDERAAAFRDAISQAGFTPQAVVADPNERS